MILLYMYTFLVINLSNFADFFVLLWSMKTSTECDKEHIIPTSIDSNTMT